MASPYVEAMASLIEFKVDGSGQVSSEQADHARDLLRAHFAGDHRRLVDFVTGGDDELRFVRELCGSSVQLAELPRGEWLEHWTDASGRPVAMTLHFYGLRAGQLRELQDRAARAGLDVSFPATPSWKHPGRAILVELTRKGPGTP